MTIWRAIPSTDGNYEASDEGQIRSVRRHNGVQWYAGRVLKQTPNRMTGYLYVSVSVANKAAVNTAHRLVCEAFHGPAAPKMDVNHKNGKRQDNRPNNLEWLSRSENQKHAYANLPRKPQPRRRAVAFTKDGSERVFPTQCDLARFLGVNPGSVSSAARSRSKCRGGAVRYV